MPALSIAKQLGVDSLAVWYALKKQGIESRGHGNKIKEDVLQRMVELRKAGRTVAEISEATGVRHCTVHNWFLKLGVKFPKEQRHFGGPRRMCDPIRAAELRKTGLTWKEIAKELGMKSGEAVMMAVRRAGLWEPKWHRLKAALA
jgi:hypothetical protein